MSQMSVNEAPAPIVGWGAFGWSEKCADGATVVRVVGDLDWSAAEEFGRRLAEASESSPSATLVLDMSDVRFIDCSIVNLLVTASDGATARGRALRIEGLHGLPARIFAILGLDRMLAGGASNQERGGDRGDRYGRTGGAGVRRRAGG